MVNCKNQSVILLKIYINNEYKYAIKPFCSKRLNKKIVTFLNEYTDAIDTENYEKADRMINTLSTVYDFIDSGKLHTVIDLDLYTDSTILPDDNNPICCNSCKIDGAKEVFLEWFLDCGCKRYIFLYSE